MRRRLPVTAPRDLLLDACGAPGNFDDLRIVGEMLEAGEEGSGRWPGPGTTQVAAHGLASSYMPGHFQLPNSPRFATGAPMPDWVATELSSAMCRSKNSGLRDHRWR